MQDIIITPATNGYTISHPNLNGGDFSVTTVVQQSESIEDPTLAEQTAFVELANLLSDLLGVYNSKHNDTGFICATCSEHIRWTTNQVMESSLKDPMNVDTWEESDTNTNYDIEG